MGIRTGVVSVGETPVAKYDREALPSIASADVESQRWRAFGAPGRGGTPDAFDWTVFSFALLALTPAIRSAAPGRPLALEASLVASALGALASAALTDRLARVRVLMRVIGRYPLVDTALPAGARKGAR